MCKIICGQDILLDLASNPGWNGNTKNLEQRTSNIEKLHHWIEIGQVEIFTTP